MRVFLIKVQGLDNQLKLPKSYKKLSKLMYILKTDILLNQIDSENILTQ